MIKRILFAIFSTIILSFFCASAWAKHDGPLLVLDMRNVAELPKNFRMTSITHPHIKTIDWHGLSDLHIAGGAQFSVLSLHKILEAMFDQSVTIIDLREESHGFLDGNAISWYSPHNAGNANKTPEQIEDDQSDRLDDLEKTETAKVYEIIKKSPAEVIELVHPLAMPIHRVFSEEELALYFQINYERIYVQDFLAPDNDQVDRFVNIAKDIPQNEWIYFHCRAGVGRTTTFMAMYDMLRNAKHVRFNDILERQTAIGGKDMRDMPAHGKWKYKFAMQRLKFLKKFYKYAHDNNDGFETSYSAWLKKQK